MNLRKNETKSTKFRFITISTNMEEKREIMYLINIVSHLELVVLNG